MNSRLLSLAAALAAVPVLGLAAQTPAKTPAYAGPTADGFLLPNGWKLRPAGEHLVLADLPLNITPLADGKRALVATSGFNTHRLSIVDLTARKVIDSQDVYQSYFGLAVSPDEGRVWWAGGGANRVHAYALADGTLTRTSEPDAKPAAKGKGDASKDFTAGLTFDARSGLLYSLDINLGTITARPAKDPKAGPRTGKLGGRPYDVVVGRNGARLFVSDWAGRQVLVVDPADLRVTARIPVGEHPNQMALHPKDDRLFVACASTNSVAVLDTKRGVVLETVYTTLFPRAPAGSTPCAVAVSPDGGTLYVANADNNCVCVVDVAVPHKSAVKGFIPTGWYPVSVAVTPDGKRLLVGVGKGLGSKPNPRWKKEEAKDEVEKVVRKLMPFPYIGTLMSGAMSVVPVPDEKKLAEYTATVYRCCPYSDEQLTAAPHPVKTAIPTKVGDESPIEYVIYIIKENRTYDQVFGAMKQGNGDPSLVLFGEDVTPNHHKLATEFVLLDNLYCNGQVSRDGHPWSTMAYNTDYIGRDWHLTYSRRKGVEDDDEGNLSNAPSGYIWDACARAGVSYRSYGEYGKRVSDGAGEVKMEGRVPGLVGKICPDYGIPKVKGARPRDTDNVEVFLKEYRRFEKDGTMPRFIVMSLGEDHTSGTTPGAFTPKACVASNDLALGRLVEAVSGGKLWPKTAIFVIEDDAQNGPDHVDCHRTVGLVISPYTKRKAVDSTHYTTVSLIRTMELILGLSPLSQYDAAARPMFNSFTDKADLTPYKHAPAEIDLNAKNDKLA
ncbi:MAG: bifunctional YncE family protein/alkaline phosphatase family protein, partial [Gemmataceae bacterium]